jgi:hypothetical protein
MPYMSKTASISSGNSQVGALPGASATFGTDFMPSILEFLRPESKPVQKGEACSGLDRESLRITHLIHFRLL